ncbi:uncharacterized protein C8Q71DRAFT_745393 [Rhodofomes roseus]|uniref:G domain-containing protein n=1 Tax=Rhodofomes roseus TaxID=34475 RepID=A0ABQ8KNK8_9APHY|nr:uncharacterized protein C8Q71DRAFT_745393 [Rhodofomes roseus]KAH9840003.1 hypothetical protein C8Q71DRAFT_745393 [Rhodofomes roseus]
MSRVLAASRVLTLTRQVLFTGHVEAGKSALLRAVVNHKSLITCSLRSNGEVIMLMGVGKGKPLGSFPAKLIIADSAGYDEDHGSLVKLCMQIRPQLRRVFLMVDAAKGLREPDQSMLQHIANITHPRFSVQPVLTKMDLIEPENRDQVSQRIHEAIQVVLPRTPPPILTCVRAEKRLGIEEMRRSIAEACEMPVEEAFQSRNLPKPKSAARGDATNRTPVSGRPHAASPTLTRMARLAAESAADTARRRPSKPSFGLKMH